MRCGHCGLALEDDEDACSRCGQIPTLEAKEKAAFVEGLAGAPLASIVLVDGVALSEIGASPVFRFLALIAIVPLGIQLLSSNHAILYALAVWSATLWSLLLFRLFADRGLAFSWGMGTALFTCFIGLPLLELFLHLVTPLEDRLGNASAVAVLVGSVLGIGLREELIKALPLLLALHTGQVRRPVNGLVLGMLSGVGFAAGENVYYVYQTLDHALKEVEQSGTLGALVMPVYNNVTRMAMTPFLHGCFSGILGYFLALSLHDPRRRIVFACIGLGLAAGLHGLYDAVVGASLLAGIAVQAATFLLLMTYVLKARGIDAAEGLGGGVFSRTVMRSAPLRAAARTPGAAVVAAPFPKPAPRPAVAAPFVRLQQAPPAVPVARGQALGALAPRWTLRGIDGPSAGRSFQLAGRTIVGRDAGCSIVLEDPSVSRRHAELLPGPDGLRFRRLSGTSGVVLNGTELDEGLARAGDRIELGESSFELADH